LTGYKDTRAHALHFFPGDYGDDEAFDPFGEDSDYDKDDEDIADEAFNDPMRMEIREKMREEEEKILAQRKRWIINSFPKEWPTIIDERGRSYGRGGRKTSSARVWIQPGFGEVVVNRKPFTEYFIHESDREQILLPFVVTDTIGLFDVQATVQGGGTSGQAGAIRHGVARALNAYNPDLYRPALKFKGYLTRDPRMVERKKVGLVKARKAPQWVRR
jgi:small subunit ribosomal protein S9